MHASEDFERLIERKLGEILGVQREILHKVERMENLMSTELDALTSAVNAEITVEQSAITLINGLAAQIKAVAEDPAAVSALADKITASSSALAAALAANTPAPVPPPATPPAATPAA